MYEQNYDPAFMAGLGMMFWLFVIGAYLFFSYVQYRIANKCGCEKNAWWSFIPIMNTLLLCEMAEKPYWWFILFLVPIVNLVAICIIWFRVAENAGHGGIWGILVIVPLVNIIALLYLGFAAGEPKRFSPPPPNQQYREKTPQNVG